MAEIFRTSKVIKTRHGIFSHQPFKNNRIFNESNLFKKITMGTSHEPATAYSSEKSGTSENISQGYGINFKKISRTGIKTSLVQLTTKTPTHFNRGNYK